MEPDGGWNIDVSGCVIVAKSTANILYKRSVIRVRAYVGIALDQGAPLRWDCPLRRDCNFECGHVLFTF